MASFSCGFILHVTNQTNLYAVHHDKGNFNILEEEFRTLIAVLLLSMCCKVSYRNFYWADESYTHHEAVSSAVCRNRFRELLLSFHLTDNTQTTEGRYYKVRVLFEKLYFNFKQYGSFVSLSADESIVLYYRKHSTKQFIRGCPIRFGFKLFP